MPPNGGAGDDTPVPWQTAVPKMLAWVESALIFWDKPGPHSPPVQYGARCVSEQRDDPNRMSCHTSSVSAATTKHSFVPCNRAKKLAASVLLHRPA